MKKDNDEKEDRVELKEKKEYIVYKDIINNYWESQSYHPINNFDEFITKKKSIRNAMLLLPMDSKDPIIIDKVKSLIKEGLDALKKQPPAFKMKYHFTDIGHEGRRFIQEISSEDGGTWSCPLEPENTKQAISSYKEEQYKIKLEDLIEIEFKISKFLVKCGIIDKEDKGPDKLIEDYIKLKFQEKIDQIEQNRKKSNKTIDKVENA